MSQDSAAANSPASTSPTVALFQRAHAKMVTLSRIDEQLQALLEQRRKLQDELRGVQALINEEFERVMQDSEKAPARLLAAFADGKQKRNGSKDTLRLEVAEAV